MGGRFTTMERSEFWEDAMIVDTPFFVRFRTVQQLVGAARLEKVSFYSLECCGRFMFVSETFWLKTNCLSKVWGTRGQ